MSWDDEEKRGPNPDPIIFPDCPQWLKDQYGYTDEVVPAPTLSELEAMPPGLLDWQPSGGGVVPWSASQSATSSTPVSHQPEPGDLARRSSLATATHPSECAGALRTVEPVLLGDFLSAPDQEAVYRVAGAFPVGARVVFSAQYKAGKSTLRDNLIRSLADGDQFLGSLAVTPTTGRIALIDNELDPRMLRRWLRTQRIEQQDRVVIIPLRGRVASFDILNSTIRREWAARLRSHDVKFLVLDCLRPVLDALGLSEDKDAGRFLVALDLLMSEGNLDEALVVHHMGHASDRPRGDTRLRDWPDAEWRLLRASAEDHGLSPDQRYFTAFGRDVDIPESLVTFDEETRRLTLVGGNRTETAATSLVPAVIEYLEKNPEASQRKIEGGLARYPRKDVRAAVRRAIADGGVTVTPGPKRAKLHSLATHARE